VLRQIPALTGRLAGNHTREFSAMKMEREMKLFTRHCSQAVCFFCLVVSLIFCGSNSALAQDQAPDSFSWSVTPYLWASETKLDLTLRNGLSVGDTVSFRDLLDTLDTAFMIHAEGGKGKWSMYGDLTYLDMSDSNERQLLTIDSESEQTFLDLGAAYWPGGVNSNLSLLGGLRYSGFDDRYTFRAADQTIGTRRTTSDYYDALIGIRYRFDLSERWSLLTRADYSFGDSEGIYVVNANFSVTVGKRRQNRILFGYQYKQAEFKDGDLKSNFTYYGPMAGFNFRW
jgi:hypothetical protein